MSWLEIAAVALAFSILVLLSVSRVPSRYVVIASTLVVVVTVGIGIRVAQRLTQHKDEPVDYATLGAPNGVPTVGDPPGSVTISATIRRRVALSVVKVVGDACAQRLSGTGWVVAEDVIATNAHVVAGVQRPEVISAKGDHFRGDIVVFDAVSDVALIRVRGLDIEPLRMVDSQSDAVLAVFGHPHGRPLRVAPARAGSGSHIDGVGPDIYNRGTHHRPVVVLAVRLTAGESGSPVVDSGGRVVAMAFAIDPDHKPVGYALESSVIRKVLATQQNEPVATSQCITP